MTTLAECGWPYYFASLVVENQATYGEMSKKYAGGMFYYIRQDGVCRSLTVETGMLNYDIEMMAAIQSPDTTVQHQGVWIEIDNDNLQEYMDMPIEVGMLIYVVRKGVGWEKDQVIYIQATTDSFEEGTIQFFRGRSDTDILEKPSILRMDIQEYNAKQYSSIRKENPDYVVTLDSVLSDFAFLHTRVAKRNPDGTMQRMEMELKNEITLFVRLNDSNDAPIITMNYAKGGVWL